MMFVRLVVVALYLQMVMAFRAGAADAPPYSTVVETRVTIHGDLTALIENRVKQKVLKESAIRTLGQQTLSYSESISSLEIVEAYTEKVDGRRLMLEGPNILTRDAATGLNAVYQRDAKVTTLIFPDVAVGDTLVYVSRTERHDRRFGNNFFFSQLLPRSIPFSSYALTVDAPESVDLLVSVRGEGLSHVPPADAQPRRHRFHYEPIGWAPEEPGSVSAWDREPLLVISTVRTMADLGARYWSSMKDRDFVTSEIQSLADEITNGIEGRKAQARAIEHWVKKNIRYVLVYLGSGGIIPNPAPVVLRNKYGDCKDHVVLTMALLKAKGIHSEQVLVSTGNMYTLPEIPSPFFNHVMLYLPDFGIYTDPTASSSAFGILPIGSYDKPVLHIAEAGGVLARTPPMQAEDHVTIAKTAITIEADGQIRGHTRQTATGAFAASARQVASRIEAQGRENYTETLLRSLGRPGTGAFEPAGPSDFSEPYTLKGKFVLKDKLSIPFSGPREMPFGMPIHKRPGVWALGQRAANRRSDFVCFASTEFEELEITFADGLPMPNKMQGITIDNKYFHYVSTYELVDRTLNVRRQFTSKVGSQVCSKDLEGEISEDHLKAMRSLGAQMMFSPPTRTTTSL